MEMHHFGVCGNTLLHLCEQANINVYLAVDQRLKSIGFVLVFFFFLMVVVIRLKPSLLSAGTRQKNTFDVASE